MSPLEYIWHRLVLGALIVMMTVAYIYDDLQGIVLGGFFLLSVMIEARWPVESPRQPKR